MISQGEDSTFYQDINPLVDLLSWRPRDHGDAWRAAETASGSLTRWSMCNLGNASISRPAVAMVRHTVLITVIVLDLHVSVSIGKQVLILFKLSLIQCVYSVNDVIFSVVISCYYSSTDAVNKHTCYEDLLGSF